MLTVLHIIGDGPHESVFRNIYDEAAFFKQFGIDVRFAYTAEISTPAGAYIVDTAAELGLAVYSLAPRPESGLNKFETALKIREMCSSYDIDILHSHTEDTFFTACLARFLGAPVTHVHTAHTTLKRSLRSDLKNRLMSIWCDEIIAINERVEAALLERLYNISKITLINDGIDISMWKDAKNSVGASSQTNSDFVVALIADPDETGDNSAFDSFAELILRLIHDYTPDDKQGRGLRFIIVTGTQENYTYAHTMMSALDLFDFAQIEQLDGLTSQRTESMRRAIYAAADLCIYHSENRYFPYPVVEAIAAGVPTMTNDAILKTFANGPAHKNLQQKRKTGVDLKTLIFGNDEDDIDDDDFDEDGIDDDDFEKDGAVGNEFEEDGADGEEDGVDDEGFGGDSEDVGWDNIANNGIFGDGGDNADGDSDDNAGWDNAGGHSVDEVNDYLVEIATLTEDGTPHLSGQSVASDDDAAHLSGQSIASDDGAAHLGGQSIIPEDYAAHLSGQSIISEDYAAHLGDYSVIPEICALNFQRPEAMARRVLTLLRDADLRSGIVQSQMRAVSELHDIDDMYIGIYNTYVKGLRV